MIAADQDLLTILTRALASVEWSTLDKGCPCCWAPAQRGHFDHCRLDVALTSAGLDTKEKREGCRRLAREEASP